MNIGIRGLSSTFTSNSRLTSIHWCCCPTKANSSFCPKLLCQRSEADMLVCLPCERRTSKTPLAWWSAAWKKVDKKNGVVHVKRLDLMWVSTTLHQEMTVKTLFFSFFGYPPPTTCRDCTPVFFVKPYMLRYNRAADNREMIEVVVLEWVFNRLAWRWSAGLSARVCAIFWGVMKQIIVLWLIISSFVRSNREGDRDTLASWGGICVQIRLIVVLMSLNYII